MNTSLEFDAKNSKQLSKFPIRCKRLSALCKIAFILFALWNLLAIIIMCYSMISADIPSTSIPLAILIVLIVTLYSANTCLLPLILSKMLDDISTSRTPFTLKNSKRLWALGVIMVLYAVLGALLDFVDMRFQIQIGDASVKIGNAIHDFAANGTTALDLFPLVIAAVFFALSYVFKYGVLLQQESDETL